MEVKVDSTHYDHIFTKALEVTSQLSILDEFEQRAVLNVASELLSLHRAKIYLAANEIPLTAPVAIPFALSVS